MEDKKEREFERVAAVIGKPGLYTLEGVSPRGFVLKPLNGSGIVFVSVHSKKVMLLKDLGIFTYEDTAPLKDVLIAIKQKESEGVLVPDENSSAEELFKFLEIVVPDYDRTKVKTSDVKKLIKWYKILKENDLLPEPDEQEGQENETESEPESEQVANTKSEETKSSKKTSKKKSGRKSRNKKQEK
ncbi:MAG: hypothetical protein GXO48_06020 [Chlorobi bacterium]|nr:hypothetical protein [Chlorobiota bacterium]